MKKNASRKETPGPRITNTKNWERARARVQLQSTGSSAYVSSIPTTESEVPLSRSLQLQVLRCFFLGISYCPDRIDIEGDYLFVALVRARARSRTPAC